MCCWNWTQSMGIICIRFYGLCAPGTPLNAAGWYLMDCVTVATNGGTHRKLFVLWWDRCSTTQAVPGGADDGSTSINTLTFFPRRK